MKDNIKAQMYFCDIEDITDIDKADYHVRIYKDYWWSTYEGKIMFYRGQSPQCNMDESIVDMINNKMGYTGKVYIPIAFVPDKIKNWRK